MAYTIFFTKSDSANSDTNLVRGKIEFRTFAEVAPFVRQVRAAWGAAAEELYDVEFGAWGNLFAGVVKEQTRRYGRAEMAHFSRRFSDGSWEKYKLVVIAS